MSRLSYHYMGVSPGSIARTAQGPVLIMAGGTGGHIFPGIAVARELESRGVPVLWLGSTVGLENELVPKAGIALERLSVSGVRGKGVMTKLVAPLKISGAVLQAIALLRRLKPRAALALGGFASGPGGIAAYLSRRPLIVHEQNSVPGVTNRALSKLARRVLTGFPNVLRGEHVGNPVRAEIAALPAPRERFANRSGRVHLLVLGGSQGAQALNAKLPALLAQLDADQRPEIRHQCGARHVEKTIQGYVDAGVAADVRPFLGDMAEAYGWADLVVCRAGALTLAELCAAGVGSVLVPFPAAVDDHQTGNARSLSERGAAQLVPEGPDFDMRLLNTLRPLLADPAARLAMAESARALARPDATARIADVCLEESQR